MPCDYTKYPKDWHTVVRPRILARAGNRCEWCGTANHEPHPTTGARVVLTIAHIHDHDPHNCSDDNLAALCQRCHNRHDAPMRARNRRRNKAAAAGQMELELIVLEKLP